MIRAIPKEYRGVKFRSTLEADWVFNLDRYRIRWQYEPEGVIVGGNIHYRPDLYLPQLGTWVEVKGPHNQRIGKAGLLADAVMHAPGCPGFATEDGGLDVEVNPTDAGGDCLCGYGPTNPFRLVVLARAADNGRLTFHGAASAGNRDPQLALVKCAVCRQHSFVDLSGVWMCRRCHDTTHGDEVEVWLPGMLPFLQIEHKPGGKRRKRARTTTRKAS